ncbi:530_t:CDS:2 [Paraglomus brasilianum]|uniref:530_t:CDS:1 n=1 Tax=Paraglomus brasilianum TaxID=144538 RepID=A0A9N8ZY72_9GLOM|nr:530_t:CDS:2 [Paraglomus brasilianum]
MVQVGNQNEKSFWQSYKAIPPRARKYIGLNTNSYEIAGIAIALMGMYISERLEERLPAPSKSQNTSTPPTHDVTIAKQ